MEFIFYVYFFVSFLLISIMLNTGLLYYVQLNNYKLKSILFYFLETLRNNFLDILLCCVIIITLLLVNINCIFFYIIYLLAETVLWLWAGNQFNYLFKITYTKRFKRIFILNIFLIAFICLLCFYLPIYLNVILFPFIFPISYFLSFLSIILLMPIENIIGKYYIKKAKNRLSQCNNLIKIGITGSYGKTSTKEILNNILTEEFYTLTTPKSYNTPFGITKVINQDLKNSHQIFLCEMGAKKIGEIKELCKLVDVDYGIVTTVGRQHTSTFGNIENVYKTKKELPDYLYNKSCVFNLINKYVAKMYSEYEGNKIGIFVCIKRDLKIFKSYLKSNIQFKSRIYRISKYFFENKKFNNMYAKNIELTQNGSKFEVWFGYEFLGYFNTYLIGIHNVINVLLALAISKMLNVKIENLKKGLVKTKFISARFEKQINNNGAIIINNGYNSNLDSAKFSLRALNLFDKTHKMVITPGLIECENDYLYNKNFGKLLTKYATEIVIVKKKNRIAILDGIKETNFDINKVYIVDDFSKAKNFIEKSDENYVILIENDLPENYK